MTSSEPGPDTRADDETAAAPVDDTDDDRVDDDDIDADIDAAELEALEDDEERARKQFRSALIGLVVLLLVIAATVFAIYTVATRS